MQAKQFDNNIKIKQNNWYEKGLENIWLPYTQMNDFPDQLQIVKTEKSYIWLKDGRKLIDGISSWWSVCHGYNHPHIIRQMQRQLTKFPHIMFAGFAHKPAYELANRLVEFVNIKPNLLNKVFFSDSGSTAVEVALKMAIQYHYNLGVGKHKFLSFKNSYHGDTLGAMSLADPINSMHAKFSDALAKQITIEIPANEKKMQEFCAILDQNQDQLAGLIIEPLVQSAGGMKFMDKNILIKIMQECQKRKIITIFDECATGFYRTGSKFAFHQIGITPDILILGKALTGGTITLAATMTKDDIFSTFLSNSLDNALMHGPTFMANPLACTAANASIDLFQQNDYQKLVKNIEIIFNDHLANFSAENVKEVRIKGAIAVIELINCDFELICKMRQNLIKYDVWLRPFANVIYIMPPLNIEKQDLLKLINVTKILAEAGF